MTQKPAYCPICYHDMSKVKTVKEHQVTGIEEVKHCPKCHTILNCDKNSVCVRCPTCMRLFSDTLTYLDHLNKNVCNKAIGVCYG